MKAILAILVLAACANAFTYKNDPTWSFFKKNFAKTYQSVEDEIERYKVFLENMQIAAYYNDVDKEARYGMTLYSDRRPSELFTTLEVPETIATVDLETVNDVPASYDWRGTGAVIGVKDQAQCGSCWAFASVACAEGAHYVKTKQSLSLSEQELVDCDTSNSGCNGGWTERALNWAKRNGGFMTEADYPYVGKRTTCVFDKSKAAVQVSNVYALSALKPVKMQESMMTYGPLAIALDASKFNSYLSGIMTGTGCSSYNVNHAVTAVGWGVEGTTDYWIIKNSWGTSWGEKGYVRLVRGSNACSCERYPVACATN